jgi:prolipoprotein diacylglyceryltransferase
VTTNHFFSFLGSANLVPVAFFESILCLLIAIVSFVVFLKFKDKISVGLITAFSFLFYGFGRFIIDFWRDEKKILLSISIGQLASLGVFVLCLVSISIILRNRRKYGLVS